MARHLTGVGDGAVRVGRGRPGARRARRHPGWQLAGEPATAAASGVRLLPYFDAYVVAGQPRALLFPGRAAERALAGGQAGNFPVLLVDGMVAGVWHAKRAGR